ncbi:DOCK family protein [Pelomyxa schiedti]|nr:DOCK family protein [Pelomyxa schiedti]
MQRGNVVVDPPKTLPLSPPPPLVVSASMPSGGGFSRTATTISIPATVLRGTPPAIPPPPLAPITAPSEGTLLGQHRPRSNSASPIDGSTRPPRSGSEGPGGHFCTARPSLVSSSPTPMNRTVTTGRRGDHLGTSAGSVSGCGDDAPGTVNWDWDSFDARLAAQRDPVLMWPNKCLEITEVVRKFDTANGLPKLPAGSHIDTAATGGLSESMKLFTKNWTCVSNVNDLSSYSSPSTDSSIAMLAYEIDNPSISQECTTVLDESLLGSTLQFSDLLQKCPEPTQTLFHVLPSSKLSSSPCDNRHTDPPHLIKSGVYIAVECQKLHLQLVNPPIEPFYVKLCLYDAQKKEKLSENFSVDLNSDLILPLVPQAPNRLKIKRCLFHVEKPSPTIFLCAEISKTLKGDYDEITEPYCKNLMSYSLGRPQVTGSVTEASFFHQVFAMGAVPLFGMGALRPLEADIPLLRCNSDLPGVLAKLTNEKECKKLRLVPGRLTITIAFNPDLTTWVNRLDYSLCPLAPFIDDGKNIQAANNIEIFEFPQPDSSFLPHLEYINLLYFYPESLNFSGYKGEGTARNILLTVKLVEDDSSERPIGLPAIYGDSVSSPLTNQARIPVVYHTKRPKFSVFDEIKIQLPEHITPRHHILVEFTHIKCSPPKKNKPRELEVPLGYCVIPIVDSDGVFIDYNNKPQPAIHYPLSSFYFNWEQNRWIDGGKPVFNFHLHLASSVFPKDALLSKFLKDKSPSLQVLRGIESTDRDQVLFFPLIVRRLLQVLTEENSVSQEAFVQLISVLDNVAKQQHRQEQSYPILETYVQYIYNFEPSELPVHEALVSQWNYFLQFQSETKQILSCHFARFLFTLIFKDVTLWLNFQNSVGRSNVIRESFKAKLHTLMHTFTKAIPLFKKSNLTITQLLNREIALFLEKLFSVINKGYLFKLIHTYVNCFPASNPELAELKWTFLRLLFNSYHFITLNIPEEDNTTTELLEPFMKKHFLSGLLLYEMQLAVKESPRHIWYQAIEILKDLLFMHDHDPRYKDKQERRKIASLYFPYLPFVISNFETLFADELRMKDNKASVRPWLICFLYIFSDIDMKLLTEWWQKQSPQEGRKLFKVLLHCVNLFAYPGAQKCEEIDQPFAVDSTAAANSLLSPTSQVTTDSRSSTRRDPKGVLERKSSSPDISQSTSENSAAQPPLLVLLWQNFSHECNRICLRIALQCLHDFREIDQTNEDIMESFFSLIEVLLSLLRSQSSSELVSFLFNVFNSVIAVHRFLIFRARNSVCGLLTRKVFDQCNSLNPLMRSKAASLLHNMLLQNFAEVGNISRVKVQSVVSLSQMVGDAQNEFESLKSCLTSITSAIHSKATSAIPEELERHRQESTKSVRHRRKSRTQKEKISSTTEASTGASEATTENSTSIQASTGVATDSSLPQSLGVTQVDFVSEMDKMMNHLHSIIAENMKLRACSLDPEMTCEIYHQLSRGFQDAPDLRVTWLNNLAHKHHQTGNFEEFAQAKILTAALVAEYLFVLQKFPVKLLDTEILQAFPNWLQENSLPSPSMLHAVRGDVCLIQEFSISGWEALLKDAVYTLEHAKLYEESIDALLLTLPLHRYNKNYKKQSGVHSALNVLCNKVVEDNVGTMRVMPNYYRVAFYGVGWGDLNQKEFVYKEQCTCRLPDISRRLKEQFGTSRDIELVPNTKEVIPSALDPNKYYIQLASLIPYWSPEKKRTMSPLEQHFNISKFLMEMPFTEGGKAHGASLEEQWKKKVIYTTKGSFPYLLKRLPIIQREEQQLSPIENAIELIQDKLVGLKREIAKKPTNIKTLQILLQGSLLAFVNSGPLEIAKIFLNKEGLEPKFHQEQVGILESNMEEFSGCLAEAVSLNKTLISQDQRPLQEELEKSLAVFQQTIISLVKASRQEREPLPPPNQDT